jgi:hypothetical protein
MLYFATRAVCPHCDTALNAWFEAEVPPDASASYLMRCPADVCPYALPFSIFKPVDEPPAGSTKVHRVSDHIDMGRPLMVLGAAPEPPSPPPPKRPWWQFWKRG